MARVNKGRNALVFSAWREGDMTRSGGSVALKEFLYQILRHIAWSVDVSLTGTVNGQEVKDGCLILEPSKGGGDAQARASGVYFVEQYKTRVSGTWLSWLRNQLDTPRTEICEC